MVVVPPVVRRTVGASELDVRGRPGVIYIVLTFFRFILCSIYLLCSREKGIYSAGDSTE